MTKRPADVIGNVVKVARIATGEETEGEGNDKAAQELGRKGGKARASRMSPERRAEIALKAAKARWKCVERELLVFFAIAPDLPEMSY